MTRRLRSHRAFRGEVDRAARHFEDEAGLGHDFVVAVGAVVRSTLRNPRIGTPVEVPGSTAEVRRRSIRRFRYHIAYVVDGGTVYLMAVAYDGPRTAVLGRPASRVDDAFGDDPALTPSPLRCSR